MRFKVNNKYIIDAKSRDDAIRVVKMLDAMETYSIRWIDTYAKSKGYGPDFWRYDTEIKANNVKEALETLAKHVALGGTGTANCLVMHVSNSHATYQFSGRLSDLLKKTKEQLGDSVKDGKYVSELKPGDVITKKDGSKWDVALVRHTPFGIQVRMNSKTSPVKTEEITYRPTDMLVYDSVKDGNYQLRYNNGAAADMSYFKLVKETPTQLVFKNLLYTHKDEQFIYVDKKTKAATYSSGEKIGRMTDAVEKTGDSVKDADEYMIEGNMVDKNDPMMTYQAYQNIARKYHLTIKNYTGGMLDLYGSKNDLQRYERDMHMSYSAIEKAHDSAKDVEPDSDVDLDFLIKDEIEAIDGYRKMIAKTTNPQLLSVLSHILDEETEHVEELRAAQAGVYEVEDD